MGTNRKGASHHFVPGTSHFPRNRFTVALQMQMALEQRQAIAARIRELRGLRTQPAIADRVGVTLRAYQAWEAEENPGGIAWENLKRLAEVFDVSEDYLLHGESGSARESPDRLTRIEAKLDRVLDLLEPEPGEDVADLAPAVLQPDVPDAARARRGRGRSRNARAGA